MRLAMSTPVREEEGDEPWKTPGWEATERPELPPPREAPDEMA
jgi:hypothetical protein